MAKGTPTKADRIRTLLKKGLSIARIATRVNTKESYVYYVKYLTKHHRDDRTQYYRDYHKRRSVDPEYMKLKSQRANAHNKRKRAERQALAA